jgi:GntR family transcriptional regulator
LSDTVGEQKTACYKAVVCIVNREQVANNGRDDSKNGAIDVIDRRNNGQENCDAPANCHVIFFSCLSIYLEYRSQEVQTAWYLLILIRPIVIFIDLIVSSIQQFMSEILDLLQAEWRVAKSGALAKVPLYHQLYWVLKDSIVSGMIPYDGHLPTELQLAEAFDVSRITAKRAMDELASEKLIARFRGKGSLVTHRYKPQPVCAPLVGMLENLAEMGKHSVIRVVSVEKAVPPAETRTHLAIEKGERAHRLVRVRSNEEGEPYAYYVSWTAGIQKGFTKRNLECTPRLNVIRDNDIRIIKIEQVLSARKASLKVAAELDVEPGAALLSTLRLSQDDSGKIVDVLDCLYNPKRFQYAMVLSVD